MIEVGHDGDHMDARGVCWEPPGATLARLNKELGSTHQIAWTGSLWLATARDPAAPHRSEVENTPEQLIAAIRRHNAPTTPEPVRSHP
ncbi:hypothetical protein ACIRPH_11435 [Nocardiopsis sp. NPDC101807]|uniref:hypothetical protein n=1 Tax=Nocardiopsis sp. NPDC101807 TaxID=3364339 RepID=UPI0037F23517